MGIAVLPPDINGSRAGFAVVGDEIRFGLAALKNVGAAFIDRLIREREDGGPFLSFKQFCERMYGIDLNKRALESLIRAGAFDCFGVRRAQLIAVSETILGAIAQRSRTNVDGQLDMFSMFSPQGDAQEAELPDIPEYPRPLLLSMEKEVSGMYLSGHPLESRADDLQAIHAVPLSSLTGGDTAALDGKWITAAGILNSVRLKTTKAGAMIAYVILEDMTGTIEMMIFSRLLQEAAAVIREGEVVMVRAQVTAREEEAPKLKVDQIAPLSPQGFPNAAPRRNTAAPRPPQAQQPPAPPPSEASQKLYLKISDKNEDKLSRVSALSRIFPGLTPLILYDARTGRTRRASQGIDAQELVLSELAWILGEDAVVLK